MALQELWSAVQLQVSPTCVGHSLVHAFDMPFKAVRAGEILFANVTLVWARSGRGAPPLFGGFIHSYLSLIDG